MLRGPECSLPAAWRLRSRTANADRRGHIPPNRLRRNSLRNRQQRSEHPKTSARRRWPRRRGAPRATSDSSDVSSRHSRRFGCYLCHRFAPTMRLSSRWRPLMKPPADLIDEFVWRPVSELAAPEVFAFGGGVVRRMREPRAATPRGVRPRAPLSFGRRLQGMAPRDLSASGRKTGSGQRPTRLCGSAWTPAARSHAAVGERLALEMSGQICAVHGAEDLGDVDDYSD